jgi:hypothetical protein
MTQSAREGLIWKHLLTLEGKTGKDNDRIVYRGR